MSKIFRFGAFSGGEPLPIVSAIFIDDLTQSTTPSLDALVDTGADGTLVPLKILQDAGFRPNRQRRRFFTAQADQPSEVVLGYSVAVRIGDLTVDEVDIYGSRQ